MIRLIRSYIRDSCGPSSIPWASIFFLSFSLSLSVCLSVYLSFSLSFCPCPQRCSGDWGDAVRRGCWAFDLFLIRLLCFAISYFIPGPSSYEIAVSEARCSEMLGEARRCSEMLGDSSGILSSSLRFFRKTKRIFQRFFFRFFGIF